MTSYFFKICSDNKILSEVNWIYYNTYFLKLYKFTKEKPANLIFAGFVYIYKSLNILPVWVFHSCFPFEALPKTTELAADGALNS